MTKRIEQKLKNLSPIPGVYLFKDKKGRVLYVGKAANLKVRVRSYFQGGAVFYNAAPSTTLRASKVKMVEEIADVEVRKTESEIEALVKEAELIKKLKPRFNVLMRDSKNYGYVTFTREEFPRIYVTHQPYKNQKLKIKMQNYVGPFTDVKALRKTLRLLRSIFPYYTGRGRPSSVERQIGLVPPEEITTKEYQANIRAIKNILIGKRKSVQRRLKKELEVSSRQENFERAKLLRDQLRALGAVISHAHVLGRPPAGGTALPIFQDVRPNFKLLGLTKDPKRIEAYDVSNIQGKEPVGSMVVFERAKDGNYQPKKSDYRKFKIERVKGANDPAMMREILGRRLKHDEWPLPDLIVVDGGKAQLNAALKALGKKKIPVVALAKRLEEVYFPRQKHPVAAERLGLQTKHLLQAMRDETHRFAVTFHRRLHKRAVIEE